MNELVTKNNTTEISSTPQDDRSQVFHLLKAAVDKGMEPDALEKLVALQERIIDKQAEQAFAASMVRVQQTVPPVRRGAYNEQTRSRYAKLEELHKVLAPLYTQEGFSLVFAEGDSPHNGMRRVICDVFHRDGHSRQYHLDLPLDDRGIKGTVNKTGTHALGSTMSYGRRYLESMIFGVVFTDQDDDGSQGGVKAVTKQQAADLIALAEEVGADKEKFLRYMKAETFEAIKARDYGRAVRALEDKRKKSEERSP